MSVMHHLCFSSVFVVCFKTAKGRNRLRVKASKVPSLAKKKKARTTDAKLCITVRKIFEAVSTSFFLLFFLTIVGVYFSGMQPTFSHGGQHNQHFCVKDLQTGIQLQGFLFEIIVVD